jgi:hypothetical protein
MAKHAPSESLYLDPTKTRFKKDRRGVKGLQDFVLIRLIKSSNDKGKVEKGIRELRRRIKRDGRYVRGLETLPEAVRIQILK